VLVWIGRFAPEKRPGLFVEALSALGDLSIRGLMVGEGPLEAAVDAAIHASPLGSRIQRLGHQTREQVAKLLGAADLLVVTSSHEGLPLVVLEALATGCPVVSIDVGDIKQVVRPGENGVLVDPTRPERLEPAIREALHQLRGEEVRARIRASFAEGHHTVEMMSQNYAAVLEELH
jgi:glycosyltransferase involved in cell wall biosynthesis